MNKINRIIFPLMVLINILHTEATEYKQTVRGTVLDKFSETVINNAEIHITNDNDIVFTTITDSAGMFLINYIPVGRHNLLVSHKKYEDAYISEILVGSAKEIVLTIHLREKLSQLENLLVTDSESDNQTESDRIATSIKTFSVEDTRRFAASINDPSRMALSFAGVNSAGADVGNEIVIRGNSPRSLLWRLEGVEIPSPNHFVEDGYSSGYVNILSSQCVDKSNFLTGAFPAEYGNALSGVFDLKMRNGNNKKREYTAKIGIMGTELAIEGPFSKKGYSSYLVNYRYSTLELLNKMGLNILGDNTPDYQDLNVKINIPTKKGNQLSIWGIGGIGKTHYNAPNDTTQ